MAKRINNVIDFVEARKRKLEERQETSKVSEQSTSRVLTDDVIRRELWEHLSPESKGEIPRSESNVIGVDQDQSGTHETVGSLYRLFDVLETMGALRRKPGVTDAAIHKLCAKLELIQKITLEDPHKNTNPFYP